VLIGNRRTIAIGKYGSFSSNLLLGRPYYATYEIQEAAQGKPSSELRIVPAHELTAELLGKNHATSAEMRDEGEDDDDGGVEFDILGENGEVVMRNNRLTVDDPARQSLSMEEIEELKKAGSGSGKEIVEKIIASHMAIGEKTKFSLAKYTVRKSRKYFRRFTVLPVDPSTLIAWVTNKEETYRIMEIRDEMLGLIRSWANIHYGGANNIRYLEDGRSQIGGARWLVVDDTGGLLVASLAEKMGILYPQEDEDIDGNENDAQKASDTGQENGTKDIYMTDMERPIAPSVVESVERVNGTFSDNRANPNKQSLSPSALHRPRPPREPHVLSPPAQTNTLTVIHHAQQPNLSFLKYFDYDTNGPSEHHPLHTHLRTLSWLQLLHPEEDLSYIEPPEIPNEVLTSMKSNKRGAYYRKRRRWERVKRIVDETCAGGFDGIVVATAMDLKQVLKHLVPLLRGGAQVVIYSPNVEALSEIMDLYSRERRSAYGQMMQDISDQEEDRPEDMQDIDDGIDKMFPVNPTLLLGAQLQTVRARAWQVLPGRTHPLMASAGGAEGYLFSATRVMPVEGKVEARGKFAKKRKLNDPHK
jgi:tRNA (adenine58-N1)-methyltransferase non-catalytic subunit